jgi:hypothetical protein
MGRPTKKSTKVVTEIIPRIEKVYIDYGKDFIDACFKNDIANVFKYLNDGVDINYKDENNNTGLMAASYGENEDLVVILLYKRADANIVNKYGNTALTMACDKGNYAIAKLLIESGADINNTDSQSNTILMVSCFNSNVMIVKLLLEYGADVHKQNNKGKRAIDMVKFHHIKELFKFYLKRHEILYNIDNRNVYFKYFDDKKYFIKDMNTKFEIPIKVFLKEFENIIVIITSKVNGVIKVDICGYNRTTFKKSIKIDDRKPIIATLPTGQIIQFKELDKLNYHDFSFYSLFQNEGDNTFYFKCYNYINFREIFE